MKTKAIIKHVHKLAGPFRITNGKKFRLKEINPGETLGFASEDKPQAQ